MSVTLSRADRDTARADAERYVLAREQFGIRLGLDRMQLLLEELGRPEQAFPAIHVVGTNGKSTLVCLVERVLAEHGLKVGSYLSPHVVRWEERVRVGGEECELARLVEGVRSSVEAADARGGDRVTQFEVLTAAALTEFRRRRVDVAVIEAGLGGRYDATNELSAEVVVLTNVGLDHTEHLGSTREAIAAEKLAVIRPGATAVLGEGEWRAAARARGAGSVVVATGARELAATAAGAFLGTTIDPRGVPEVTLPGRLERREGDPVEVWDGAHNLEGVLWLAEHLDGEAGLVLVASVLREKPVEKMLEAFARVADVLVASRSSHQRALPAEELAAIARRLGAFSRVEIDGSPHSARELGRDIAGRLGRQVLVSGSLYLLADLADIRQRSLP